MEEPKRHFYVYEHRRKSDGYVFYVGKGAGCRAWNTSRRSAFWNNVATKHGRTVHIIYEGLTEAEAFRLEVAIIEAYGGDALTNFTKGGEGSSGFRPSAESRARMSASKVGKKHTPQAIERMKGRVFTPEQKAAMSARQSGAKNHRFGKPQHENAARGIMRAVLGVPKSEDHKAKIGAARKAANGKVTLFHPDHGTVTDYQIDICRTYGLSDRHVSNVWRGKRKSHRGWTKPTTI